MKKLIITTFMFCSLVKGQSISQQVINAGGKTSTTSIGSQTIIYTDNIGEAIIGTGSANGNMLTQGFLQPDFLVANNTTVTIFKSDVTCGDKKDGFVKVDITNPPNGAWYEYFWKPSSLCPTNDCQRIDSLTNGTFSVRTVVHYTLGSVSKADTFNLSATVVNNNGPCDIKPYSGVSLSGTNKHFVIDNIEAYPTAKVCIFTRWGNQVFCSHEYNNSNNYWPRKGETVTPGTYYFIIDAGDKGTIKSWVEVIQ
jgi:hypothetical protein